MAIAAGFHCSKDDKRSFQGHRQWL